ncbi:MAG: AI-2E family transporter [Bacteroidota bacterium]|nr:AI-2E family transporter [Bacteroidota bacterium]
MYNSNNITYYVQVLIPSVLFGAVLLHYGQALFIPIAFSLLISFVTFPFCKSLEKHHIPRTLAILLALIIIGLLFFAVLLLLLWELKYLKENMPVLSMQLPKLLTETEHWINEQTGFHLSLSDTITKNIVNISGKEINGNEQVGSFLGSLSKLLLSLFIIPVFSGLFLYHREQFFKFLQSFFQTKHHVQLRNILHEIVYSYHNYIIGLVKVYFIVGSLNSLGLFLLGVPYAFLFGMISALLMTIPYAGIFISSLLPITIIWLNTGSVLYPLGVVSVFAFVQYLEHSILLPRVIGKQLNVSSWSVLVSMITGGIIWGVSGVVLFIPFTAILKMISERVPGMKALNILLSRKVNNVTH